MEWFLIFQVSARASTSGVLYCKSGNAREELTDGPLEEIGWMAEMDHSVAKKLAGWPCSKSCGVVNFSS